MAHDVGGIHVKMTIETPKAKEGSTPITSPPFPFQVVDATQMTQLATRALLRLHQLINSRTQGFATVLGVIIFNFVS